MSTGNFRMNPAAWMLDTPMPPQMSDTAHVTPQIAPAMPFHCNDDMGMTTTGGTGTSTAAAGIGGIGGGPLAEGPGLAAILFSQKTPTPIPTISPMPSTVPGLISGTGEMPNVNQKDLAEVTNGIICQCGCGLTVYACELSMPCSVSPKMKFQAAVYLAQGMTPAEVLDQFAKDFGEKVLAAPTKSGINLVAWVLPFVGLAVGAGLVGWALVNWKSEQATTVQGPQETDTEMLARIEDEVKKGL
jgi:cytochrome c-type biogenesis protein CcmH